MKADTEKIDNLENSILHQDSLGNENDIDFDLVDAVIDCIPSGVTPLKDAAVGFLNNVIQSEAEEYINNKINSLEDLQGFSK